MNNSSDQSTPSKGILKTSLGTVIKIIGGLIIAIAGALSMAARHVPGAIILIPLVTLCSWGGYKLFRAGKKMKMALAEDALADDPRAPILYLRSFNSDKDADQSVGGKWYNHLFRFAVPANLATEEEQIAMLMNCVGPFVAIGRPGEILPQLGAYRTYIDDYASEGESLDLFWKSKVLDLMDRSCLIVMRVGDTEGFWWEVGNVREIVDPRKVVFLLPEKQKDYDPFRKKAEAHLGVELPDFNPEEIGDRSFGGLMWFQDDWTPHIEYCKDSMEGFSNRVASDLNAMMTDVWTQTHIDMPGAKDKPAPIWRRLVAQLIDIGIFVAIIWAMVIGFSFIETEGNGDLSFLGFMMIPVGVYVYFGALEASRWGGTPGKAMLGLSTQDKNGTPITMQQGLLRFVFKIFGAIIWPVILILLALGKRTMHDKFAKTRVVMVHKN
jgi:uncharacterized RDD family membrane protein YckC